MREYSKRIFYERVAREAKMSLVLTPNRVFRATWKTFKILIKFSGEN